MCVFISQLFFVWVNSIVQQVHQQYQQLDNDVVEMLLREHPTRRE